MIEICKNYNLLTKEHNSDYLCVNNLIDRFKTGLDSINIAPELGQIQTKVYLEEIPDDLFEDFFTHCLNSKKWEKWVNKSFNPEVNKKELILTCGHYIFKEEFIKENFNSVEIRNKVENNIQEKIKSIIAIINNLE